MHRMISIILLILMALVATCEGVNLTVTTTKDGGPGSFREAISIINSRNLESHIIYLPAGTYYISGTARDDQNLSGDLDIDFNGNLTIIGEGEGHTIIDGGLTDRVLDIFMGNVTIIDMTIQNGKLNCPGKYEEPNDLTIPTEHGGGIRIHNATVYMKRCAVQNNTSKHGCYLTDDQSQFALTRGGDGGGIWNNHELYMDRCTIKGNASGNGILFSGSERGGHGGGIFNSGEIVLTNCEISDNSTGFGEGHGGGIYSYGKMTLSNCDIHHNRTGNGFSDISYAGDAGDGGGIYNDSIAWDTAKIQYCTIHDNTTGNGGDANEAGNGGDGAGIANNRLLILTNSSIFNNSTGNGGINGSKTPGKGGFGGGIYSSDIGDIKNCTISGNKTGCGGSGEIQSEDGHGGGIYNLGDLHVIHCTIADNGTGENEAVSKGYSGGYGGGIYHHTDYYQFKANGQAHTADIWPEHQLHLANTILADNRIPAHGQGSEAYGDIYSDGYNLIETVSGINFSGDTTGNITGMDPELYPLRDLDYVHDFKYNSPVIDAGNSFDIFEDQNGSARPVDCGHKPNIADGADIGAYEYNAISKPEISISTTRVNFGINIASPATQSKTFKVANKNYGYLYWEVSADKVWITVSPDYGSGTKDVTVKVNPTGFEVGVYQGTVTVSSSNAVNSPQEITVVMRVYPSNLASAPFGSFDSPGDQTVVAGSIAVTGWALDETGIDRVEILRDALPSEGPGPILIGYGDRVEGARTDIEAKYPQYPDSNKAGWGYMLLTNMLPNRGNGTFKLHAVAVDLDGNQTELGVKTITCDNTNSDIPFGAIDTPAQGGTASGLEYLNFGWALTPPPNAIPTDGSTITVWVDGMAVGNPEYGLHRKDIADLFPEYANSNAAAAAYYLDTIRYWDGVHTIAWSVEDNAGNVGGIGSRYFNIQNSQSRQSSQTTRTGAPALAPNHAGCLEEIPIDMNTPITIEKGYKSNTEPELKYPGENGITEIQIKPLERIKIELNPNSKFIIQNSKLTAHSVVNGKLRGLPVGSMLDSEQGVFYWQPGPAFRGIFDLVFVRQTGSGNGIKKVLRIIIDE